MLIKDRNDDTLVYAPSINIGIRDFNFRNKSMIFGKITVSSPVVAFITDTTGEMNLIWYLDMLLGREDTVQKEKSTIKISQIEVTDARFSLISMEGKKSKIPTDFSNLRLSGINGTLGDFIIHNDTTSFSINDLAFTEKEGFNVSRMNSKVVITKNDILFHSALINCDSSILNISAREASGRFSDLIQQLH